MKTHGIKYSRYVYELRVKVKSIKDNVESPPTLQVEKKWPITILGNFIGSFLSTIANIMPIIVDDDIVIQVDREIKICLAHLNIFEKSSNALPYNTKFGNKNI